MNTLEDKLRASLRQTAEEIPPHDVPPLRLTNGRRVRGPWRAPHRFLGPWQTPLAAAAAVAAVIATSVAISGVFHPHRPAAQHAAGKGGVFAALPAYYVTLYAPKPSEWPHRVIVRATATGAVVATVTPPRPFRVLEAATASGNGHDFVLGASLTNVAIPVVIMLIFAVIIRGSQQTVDRVFRLLRWITNRPEPAAPGSPQPVG